MTGILEVCKVAGPGVSAGQSFTFTVLGQTVTIAAGSCATFTGVSAGPLSVKETVPSGVTVTSIVCTSPAVCSDINLRPGR